MKKILVSSVLLIVTLLFGNMMVTQVLAQEISGEAIASEAADFEINESGVLLSYKGKATIVIVPDTVKEIGYKAFYDCTFIEKIVIPESVTSIWYNAFYNCSSLKDINLPSGLTALPSFSGCTSLKEITIPKGITPDSWFYFENDNSIEFINVSEDHPALSSIDGVVFNKDKTSLIHYPTNKKDKTYTIPDSVTTLADADFYSAKHLKKLVFGKNVGYASEDFGFTGDSFMNGILESFSVPAENKYFCDIDGVLFTKDKKVLLAYPEKKEGKAYAIPNGTERLYSWSLGMNEDTVSELKYIFVPKSVKIIDGCVGFIGYIDGLGPNESLTFFGDKGSAIETYAKVCNLKFGIYDSTSKKTQVLFDCTDVILGSTESCQVNAIVWPLNPKDTVSWKTSKKAVATVDKNGKITAKGIGAATITVTAKSGVSASLKVLVRLPKPANVKAEKYSSSKNYAKITWDKVDGAKGYDIYECGWQIFDLVPVKKIGTTTDTSYVDKNVILNDYKHYAIIACHSNKDYNSGSSIIGIYIPSAPAAVTAENSNNGILIQWDDEFIFSNEGYVIYRSTKENGEYSKIGTVSYCNNFLDPDVKKGTTYYYKVRTYYTGNNKTIYSNYSDPVKIKKK